METNHQRQRPRVRAVYDLEILERLVEVGNRCVRGDNDSIEILDAILDAAILITAADKGNIQLFDSQAGGLVIAAQRGFQRPFLEFFSVVHDHSAASCGVAFKRVHQVQVEDVVSSEIFAGQPALDVLLAEDVRAAQSTPLVSGVGKVLGVISTHFRRPTRLTRHQSHYMHLLARQAADYLERREIDETLKAKQAQLKNITENVPSLITRCSRDLRYVFVNKACADFIGQPIEQIVGRPIIDVLGEPAFQKIRPYIERVLAGEKVEYEAEIPYATKGPRYMRVAYAPDTDSGGAIVGWIGTMTDVTERRRAEQKLREADRHKDEFLAMLAHELRNPLASISAGAEILQRKVNDQELQSTLSALKRQAAHMARLVNDLMDVGRVSLGKIELKRQRIELGAVVEQAVNNSRSLVEDMGHQMKLAVSPVPVYVDADPDRLVQVLCNLINNACKFMDRGGSIELTVEARKQGVIRIRDRGIGLDAEDISRIFELFAQLDASRQRSLGGLGVGLTLAKKVVELHGGTLEAFSEGRGQGSEFVVRLPISMQESQQSEPSVVAPRKVGRRVLIVDDNLDAAESLAQLVEMIGHTTYTAFDGTQGVEAVRELRPEVVLLDIGLPKVDGYEACRRIREESGGKDIMLVALSGYGRETDVQDAHAAGFDHYLIKPVDYPSLANVLAGLPTKDDKLSSQ